MRNSHAQNLVCQIFPKLLPIIEKFHVPSHDSSENKALEWICCTVNLLQVFSVVIVRDSRVSLN